MLAAAVSILFFTTQVANAAIPTHILPQPFTQIASFLKTQPAPTPPDIIRVNLGTHKTFQIRGQDLLLGGRALGVGAQEFPVHCDTDSETPIIISGIGRVGTPATLESPSGFVWFNGHNYRARLTVYAENGLCTVVNTLSMDHYLAGLLNKEMSPSWPLEALKAQAVASRTYALYQKTQNRTRPFDVDSTTIDQVYEGSDSETVRSHLAVQMTAQTALTWQGEPIKAFYHADCGGRTEVPQDVWGSDFAYFKPVICPYHQSSEAKSKWSYAVTKPQLTHLLKRIAGLLPHNFLQIAQVEAGPLNQNQRRQNVSLKDSQGQQVIISANSFRTALGNTRVKSTAFALQSTGDGFSIAGHGYGHGVGLCQIGAREMAKQGHNSSEILHFYYPLAKLSHIQ